jgi:biopolymer transport protein ExbD
MYRRPSRKYKNKTVEKPNLIPILDAVFIFIFFLLMSANFIKIYEIQSDVPMISDAEPPPKVKKSLNLTLKVFPSNISLYRGINEKRFFKVGKNEEGDYDLYKLRERLISLKKEWAQEDTVVFMPKADIDYETLVKIMDTVRDLKDTDPEVWTKDKNGMDVKIKSLFNNIIFGDTQS